MTYKLFTYWIPKKSAGKLKLGDRLTKLIAHIDSCKSNDQKKQKIRDLLVKVDDLRKIRNKVAHNPVTLKKYDNSDYKMGLVDLRGNDPVISLEELHEFSDEAESAISELNILISQFVNKGIDEILFT